MVLNSAKSNERLSKKTTEKGLGMIHMVVFGVWDYHDRFTVIFGWMPSGIFRETILNEKKGPAPSKEKNRKSSDSKRPALFSLLFQRVW
jgi:hypothetical protein